MNNGMKKLTAFVLAMVCVVAMAACNNQTAPQKRWDCIITCAEESSDNAYVISYSDEKIISNTGILTIDNKNDFDIIVHLITDGNERVEEVGAGVIVSLYQIVRDTEYTLGCHADVPEGTEIIIPIYDGAGNVLSD